MNHRKSRTEVRAEAVKNMTIAATILQFHLQLTGGTHSSPKQPFDMKGTENKHSPLSFHPMVLFWQLSLTKPYLSSVESQKFFLQ